MVTGRFWDAYADQPLTDVRNALIRALVSVNAEQVVLRSRRGPRWGRPHCPVREGHARILWTLPVTTAEIEFRRRHGHEALELLFDEVEIIPTDPFRAPVASFGGHRWWCRGRGRAPAQGSGGARLRVAVRRPRPSLTYRSVPR